MLSILIAAAAPAVAQNANTVSTVSPPPRAGTVGPEQLRDFSLGGSNARADDEQRPVVPRVANPAPRATRPAPTATVPITARPAPDVETRVARPAQRPAPPVAAPARRVTVDLAPATPAPIEPNPGFQPAAPPVPEAAPVATSPDGSSFAWWPWLLAPLTLAGVLFAWLRRRRTDALEVEEMAPAFAATAVPEPEPELPLFRAPPPAAPTAPPLAPAAAPRSGGIVSTRLRAQIDIELVVEAAALTEDELTLHFDLRLLNSGASPARNLIVEALALNAGDDQDAELAAFFARPDAEGQAMEALLPLDQTNVRSTVRMPRGAMREYAVEGRRLLVPILAFNVAYRFGSGVGRTSGAWLIGRGGAGDDRLGPLRLDLGPRQWTDVAQKLLEAGVRR